MTRNIAKRGGFTLIEAVSALAIFCVAMALAMAGFSFLLTNTNQENAQTELDIDVQQTMERLKFDLRLSSLDEIFYYEDENGSFQALSFPLGQDTDGNGILDKDTDGTILWGAQLVYHIKATTPHELTKTTFRPRAPALSDAERQYQLESVVANGNGSSTFNGGNATSTMLFRNLLKWEILPIAGRFDAFSDTDYHIREEASLGYALIAPGSHTFNFKVVGKNTDSDGFNIGIDQLYVSASYGAREAEAQSVTANSGATATPEYMPAGSWKGRHQLFFPAQAVGDNFTLTMENDRWEETNFSDVYQAEDTETSFDPGLTDFVTQLAGMETTWSSAAQTGDLYGSNSTNSMANFCIRILLKGGELLDTGNWFAYNGKQCKLTFQASYAEDFSLSNVFIGESDSTNTESMVYGGTPTRVRFLDSSGNPHNSWSIPNNTQKTSAWVDLEIDRNKNYLVSYRIDKNNTGHDAPKRWRDINGSAANTILVAEIDPSSFVNNLPVSTFGSWSSLASAPGVNLYSTNYLFGLESVFVNYPTNGTYTSKIFDTHLASPQYGDLAWNADEPSNTSVLLKVRTGANADLSDASDWSTLAASSVNPRAIGASYKRYIQFQALLTSDPNGQQTPKLQDVTIDWDGEEQLVNIGGIFTKGDDYGTFEASVDGQPLRSALIVELEIYKNDVRGLNHTNRTISSSLKVDMTPRNSGL